MKIVDKILVKKQKQNKKPVMKSKKEHVLIISQEIKFARFLSSNEKKTRDRALKTLKKWLVNCLDKGYEFKESDFLRIWKGLFYAVWISDKPLVQEELCENISGILQLFPADQIKSALLLVKVGFKVLAKEWFGIDHHRMDKCLMLVRRYLRGSFGCLLRCGWSLKSCRMYAKMLGGVDGLLALKTPVFAKNAISLVLHILDIYLEEISKVSKGDIPEDSLTELLRPVCAYMCSGVEPVVCASARKLLTELMRHSDVGAQYRDKTVVWQSMGCPAGGPDALEPASDDENNDQDDEIHSDEESSPPLDPRAGRVHVRLAPLPVPAARLASMLDDMRARCSSKAYKRAKLCVDRFKQLSQNTYPLKLQVPAETEDDKHVVTHTESAHLLHNLEKQLVASADELALRGLKRRHRKRLLAKSRAGMSIVEELDEVSAVSTRSANGDWKIEDTEPQKKKKKPNEKDSSKETLKKKIQKEFPKNDFKLIGDVKTPKQTQSKNVTVKKDGLKEGKQKKEKPDKRLQKNANNVIVKKDLTKNDAVRKKSQAQKQHPPTVVVEQVKHYSLNLNKKDMKNVTPKKVKFVLKNNSMQEPVEYYQSIRMSPNIPFDSSKKPSKANLKPSTPSPINPFFKNKLSARK